MYLAVCAAAEGRGDFWVAMRRAAACLLETRPTAVNLRWAVERMVERLRIVAGAAPEAHLAGGATARRGRRAPQPTIQERAAFIQAAGEEARRIADSDALWCRQIGEHGVAIIDAVAARKGGNPVNILTHCNAGWLAFVDYGSATAPIYAARRRSIPLHVWVDETRPWNQGARLTAWELLHENVPHHVITDNCGGHLMQRGEVDLVLVGSDRTTACGDVANKIGTYLKALAAWDNRIPFYVALPSSSIDWQAREGLRDVPIEKRSAGEVKTVRGWSGRRWTDVAIAPAESPAANHVFDVTPARLVTGLITERGVCAASEEGLRSLFPERFTAAP
jgi:methylthioribose-1-phosphate isomerase